MLAGARGPRRRRDLGADAVVDPRRADRRYGTRGRDRAGAAVHHRRRCGSRRPSRRSSTCATRSSPPSVAQDGDDILWTCSPRAGWATSPRPTASDDVAPVADFTDPADLTPTGGAERHGPRRGRATRSPGATVGIAGHDTGARPDAQRRTSGRGRHVRDRRPADRRRPQRISRGPRAQARLRRGAREDVPVPPESGAVDFTLVRDWSSSVNGAAVASASPAPTTRRSGCGPGGLIDDDPGVVWGTARRPGGQRIVVDLGAPIDVAERRDRPRRRLRRRRDRLARAVRAARRAQPRPARGRRSAPGTFGPEHVGPLQHRVHRRRARRALRPAARRSAAGRRGRDERRALPRRRRAPRAQGARLADRRRRRHRRGAGRRHRRRDGSTGTVTAVRRRRPRSLFEYGTTTQYGASGRGGRRSAAGTAPAPCRAAVAGLCRPRPPTTSASSPCAAAAATRARTRRSPRAARRRRARRRRRRPPRRRRRTRTTSDPPASRAITSKKLTADRQGMFKVRVDVRRRRAGRDGARARARRASGDAARQRSSPSAPAAR